MPLTLAIVGRPNVGKSTLFNRLTGRKHALVDNQPGVTRDRREGQAELGPLQFTLIDTAGLEQAKEETLQARMFEQTGKAVAGADAVLFVIDGRAGVTPADQHFAQWLRKQKKPVILIANKAEDQKTQNSLGEAFKLGMGEPVALSAEHGEGLGELYDAIVALGGEEEESEDDAFSEEQEESEDEAPKIMQLAIIGRPNVGKSTLLNALLGEERVLTGPEAGITRDSIAVDYDYQGRQLRLIDTAGIRKRANVQEKVEKLAVADTLRAVQYAHVVILVLDAEMPLDRQDVTLGSLVEKEGRALVVAVNKWDKVPDPEAWTKALRHRLDQTLSQNAGVTIVPISAQRKNGLKQLIKAAFDTYEVWNRRIGTGELNRWLENALMRHSPPMVDGRPLKIRYITQTKTRPPTFLLFINKAQALPDSYKRYLVGGMREAFDLPGVPIRIVLRKGKNPYDPET